MKLIKTLLAFGIIKGKGAFRYFKDTVSRLGLLPRWYQYLDEAMTQFVLDWAEVRRVPIIAYTEGSMPR